MSTCQIGGLIEIIEADLNKKPTDWDLRRIYADLLDDDNKHKEADFQRWLADTHTSPVFRPITRRTITFNGQTIGNFPFTGWVFLDQPKAIGCPEYFACLGPIDRYLFGCTLTFFYKTRRLAENNLCDLKLDYILALEPDVYASLYAQLRDAFNQHEIISREIVSYLSNQH